MQDTKNKMCGRCGSNSLISDRSLGGKIICVQCGSSFIRSRGFRNSKNRNLYFLLLILLVIFIILIFRI